MAAQIEADDKMHPFLFQASDILRTLCLWTLYLGHIAIGQRRLPPGRAAKGWPLHLPAAESVAKPCTASVACATPYSLCGEQCPLTMPNETLTLHRKFCYPLLRAQTAVWQSAPFADTGIMKPSPLRNPPNKETALFD